MSLFTHVPHPHVAARRQQGPVKTADQHKQSGWYSRLNAKIAIWATAAVGSMSCAWLFALLAFAGLKTAMAPGNIGLLFWFSSDFLQLTLLSVIMVGQNIAALASDKRAEQTYLDAEAVLEEARQIQGHLAAQDQYLTKLAAQMQDVITAQKPSAELHVTADAAQVAAEVARQLAGRRLPRDNPGGRS
jgi:hypothetical protein